MTTQDLAQEILSRRGYIVICPTRAITRFPHIVRSLSRDGEIIDHPFVAVAETDPTDYLEQCEVAKCAPRHSPRSKFYRVVTD